MKQQILTNWNFFRFLRLGFGLAIVVHSVVTNNWSTAILGLVFTAMPIFNVGCCGTGGCSIPGKKNAKAPKEVAYEEVVSKKY